MRFSSEKGPFICIARFDLLDDICQKVDLESVFYSFTVKLLRGPSCRDIVSFVYNVLYITCYSVIECTKCGCGP